MRGVAQRLNVRWRGPPLREPSQSEVETPRTTLHQGWKMPTRSTSTTDHLNDIAEGYPLRNFPVITDVTSQPHELCSGSLELA